MKVSNTSERLKELMLSRKIKQVDILKKAQPFCNLYNIKLGKSDLSQFVSGKVEPGQSKLTILGLALNVSEAWLMGYDVPMERSQPYPSNENISSKLSAILKYRDISVDQLADQLNIDKSVLSAYLSNSSDNELYRNSELLNKISEYLGLSLFDDIYGYHTFGDDEFQNYISFLYHKVDKDLPMTDYESKVLANYINDKIPSLPSNVIPIPKMAQIPLIGTIACGIPILAEENVEDYVNLPEHVHADFALRCKGDSMINARIFNGDIVYIKKQPIVDNGEVAAVLIGDEATLKRVQLYDDHISLEAANPMFQPIVRWGEEMNNVRIIGKAVAFTSIVR